MRPTTFLINTARAALIDQHALYDALTTGRLAGAALDTAVDHGDNPLIDLPNVVSTPHLGNRCVEGVFDVMRAAIDHAAAVLRGERPPYLLNPAVQLQSIGKG
jgi:phosphoglycerate dehydrogenase-like enzyme